MPTTLAAAPLARRPPSLTDQLHHRLAHHGIQLFLDHGSRTSPADPAAFLGPGSLIFLEQPAALAQALTRACALQEHALRRHRPPGPVTLLFPLPPIERAIDARLDLCGTWEAKALRGQGAAACAVLAHHEISRHLSHDARRRDLHRQSAPAPRLVFDLRTPDGGLHHAGHRLLLPGTGLVLHATAAEAFARGLPTPYPRPLSLTRARHLHACLTWAGALPHFDLL
ncbi:hypothetical protein ABZ299_17210 [Streptomyces sp. NPDC006184]|uniref:hypothetical protein n=1 Tax=Streptomyces sp. NPDC006184 TaxID=3155455 RepID=UPI0033A49FE2